MDSKLGIEIASAWTQAGTGSCVHVKNIPQNNAKLDILFDIGIMDTTILSATSVFITHSHIDHIGAALSFARIKVHKGKPAIYYVPESAVGPLLEAKKAFEKLDQAEIPMDIRGVCPGYIVNVSSSMFIKVFRTTHRIESQGYALFRVIDGGLDPRYLHLSSREIVALKESGVQVKLPDRESIQMVYTGDSTIFGVISPENRFIFEAPILFVELTYVDGPKALAEERGHIHLDDIIQYAALFTNPKVVFCHISSRYSLLHIVNVLRRRLPSNLAERVYVTLKSFGATEELTKLTDVPLEQLEGQAGFGWITNANTAMKAKVGKVINDAASSSAVTASRGQVINTQLNEGSSSSRVVNINQPPEPSQLYLNPSSSFSSGRPAPPLAPPPKPPLPLITPNPPIGKPRGPPPQGNKKSKNNSHF